LQNIGLEEYRKKGAIEAATEEYLNHTEGAPGARLCPELETQAEQGSNEPLIPCYGT